MSRLVFQLIVWSFTVVTTSVVIALMHEAIKGDPFMIALAVGFLTLLIWFAISSEKRQDRRAAEAQRVLELWRSHSHTQPPQG